MRVSSLFLALLAACALADDWPTVRHDATHSGYTEDELVPPVKVLWKRSFENAPIATCVEPIVGDGKVFVGSLNGTVYAVKADDGSTLWSMPTKGPILQSPTYASGKVYVGSVDGFLYCMDAATGRIRWRFDGGRGGFAASPTFENGTLYIGSRNGTFYSIMDEGETCRQAWRYDAGAPIWQPAALGKGRSNFMVYFMSENMVAHALRREHGILWWKSQPVGGHRARDYPPFVLGDHIVFRTGPADAEEAVVKEGGAILLKASTFSGKNEVVIARELDALIPWNVPDIMLDGEGRTIDPYLARRPEHRTCYILNPEDGTETPTPILYIGGCGGVANPPTRTRDDTVIIGLRSLYTGWIEKGTKAIYGTAPRYGLAKLNLGTGRVTRLDPAPPGKIPWGVFLMANESASLQVGGRFLYIVHQATLCAVDLLSHRVTLLLGARDLWGGEPALGWAANEWRGPARGGIAISNGRAYWIVGSHLLALEGQKQ